MAGELPATGEVQPLLLDLVNRGIIRILDIAFLTKGEDGSVSAVDVGDLKQVAAAFAEFEGASSGLLGYEDLEEAAAALEPGTAAAVLVWENRWAAPVAAALRRSGGQLVASGRIPVQAILAALDEVEATPLLTKLIKEFPCLDCFVVSPAPPWSPAPPPPSAPCLAPAGPALAESRV